MPFPAAVVPAPRPECPLIIHPGSPEWWHSFENTGITSITCVEMAPSFLDMCLAAFGDGVGCKACSNTSPTDGPNNITYRQFYATPIVVADLFYSNAIDIHMLGFSCCRQLKRIVLPRALSTIHSMAFAWCTSLVDITFPESLVCIGEHAFMGCKELVRVHLPENLVELGQHAFSYCKKLTTVKFGSKLKKLHLNTFLNCPSLKSLSLPPTLLCVDGLGYSGGSLYIEATAATVFHNTTVPCVITHE